MVGYTKPERRTFLRLWVHSLLFLRCDPSLTESHVNSITGAPKLPLGGFKALHPQFTVVRKREPPPFKPDDYLPSVMTCAQVREDV
jgi:E3 ubiquitin-protein ligase TRIP12